MIDFEAYSDEEFSKIMNGSKIYLEAMRRKLPVIHKKIKYDRIIDYVLWFDGNGKLRQSVVLLQRRSSVRVLADEITIEQLEAD